jgi:hypothetical protein
MLTALPTSSLRRTLIRLRPPPATLMVSVGSGSALWSVRARGHRRRKKRGDCLLDQRATTTILAQGRERSLLTDRKCGQEERAAAGCWVPA